MQNELCALFARCQCSSASIMLADSAMQPDLHLHSVRGSFAITQTSPKQLLHRHLLAQLQFSCAPAAGIGANPVAHYAPDPSRQTCTQVAISTDHRSRMPDSVASGMLLRQCRAGCAAAQHRHADSN